jgi:gamma-glutamylcyclotransferase (GGCT)/AIG2-like uncharacterized protein YtfP
MRNCRVNISNHLFAYGTLLCCDKRYSHRLLRGQAQKAASIPGKLFSLGSYPGAVPHHGMRFQRVYGRLFRLKRVKRTLAELDRYEECSTAFAHPHEYRRVTVKLRPARCRLVSAWIYLYNYPTQKLSRIPGGKWCCNNRKFIVRMRQRLQASS